MCMGQQMKETERLLQWKCIAGDAMILMGDGQRERINPHAFDGKNSKGTFLFRLVQAELAHQNRMPEQSKIFPAFFRQRCFLEVGILLDDVSNYTMVSGVRVQKKDGSFHAGVEGLLCRRGYGTGASCGTFPVGENDM